MTAEKFKRKLAAILSADVKGYSRLMGEDEEGTIRTLNTYKEAMAGFIQKHQGRMVGTAGDSILVEFSSVVDAVRCAVEIQEELKDRNKELPEDRRMEFRLGVNLGDVVEEGDTILGDGVNVAARVESLADGGGICISGTVYDQIKNKLAFSYDYVGEQAVKNIKEPVRVYRVRMEPEITAAKVGQEKRPAKKGLPKAALGIIAVVVIVGAVTLYQFVLRPSASKTEVASKEKMALSLPDSPSIAVLPFVNMSEDAKQEFLSDGITESIITALSKVRDLMVISRQSTFTYKGKPVKVKQVSEELGVRYVLEGSVQRSNNRIRINAQLIDALTGNHIWAEQYERDLKDIFYLQDEITAKILTAIRVKLTVGEQASGVDKYFKEKNGLNCYLKFLEGMKYYAGHNIEDLRVARRIVEEGLAMCPENPALYALLGAVHWLEYWFGSGKSSRESIEKGIEMCQKALAIDDSVAGAHSLLSFFYSLKRDYDKSLAEAERGLDLAPGAANAHEAVAMSLHYAGRYEEAIPMFQKALRLNPFGSTGIFQNFGNTLRAAGRFEEAVSAYKKSLQRAPDNFFAHLHLCATYSMIGKEKEARAEAAEVLRINPKFSVDSYSKLMRTKDQSFIDNSIKAWRKAGLK